MARKKAVGAGSTAMLSQLQIATAALEMRLQGGQVPRIAEALGQPVARVRQLISDAVGSLGTLRSEKAEELRELDLARLDMLFSDNLADVKKCATATERAAIRDKCRSLIETRAKLAGLNAPIQVEQRIALADVTPPQPMSEAAKAILAQLRGGEVIDAEVVSGG